MGPAAENARGSMAHGQLADTQQHQQARMRRNPSSTDTACRPSMSAHGQVHGFRADMAPPSAASGPAFVQHDGGQGRPCSRSQHSSSWSNSTGQRTGSRAGGLRSPTSQVPPRDSPSTAPSRAHTQRTSGPNMVDTTDEAAALFKAAGLMFSPGMPESLSSSGQFRPPPAGMRGALSWGVGPNAYENDGRPGTRGGREYDLDGRPLTRNGGRPASRMQLGLTGGRPSTGLVGTQPPPGGTLEPVSYAAATSSGSQHRHSVELPGQPGLVNSLPMQSPSRQHGDRKAALGEKASSAGGRATMQPFGRPAGAVGSSGGAAQSAPLPSGQAPLGGSTGQRSHAKSKSKNVEEGDVDAFLDALSGDDEVDNANMDDMRNYLNKMSCDGSSKHKAVQNETAQTRQQQQRRQQEQQRQQQQQQQQQQELQQQKARRQRAMQAAERVVAVLIEQAVKTAEVNAIIRTAEEKALAQEAQLKVVLAEHGWQDGVRAAVGPLRNEFQGLMSSVVQAGSKLPDGKNMRAVHPAPITVSVNPDDDFKHLPGLHNPGALRPVLGRGGNHMPGALSPTEASPSSERARSLTPLHHSSAMHGNVPALMKSSLAKGHQISGSTGYQL